MVVLGLGFTNHDASAALAIDGRIHTAIARERLTRMKRDGMMWGTKRTDLSDAITYCLAAKRMTLQDVDLVVWSHIDHLAVTAILRIIELEGGTDLSGSPIVALPHHFAHACSAFYLSPYKDAAVLVVDGAGGPLGGLTANCSGPENELAHGAKFAIDYLGTGQREDAREYESFYHHRDGEWRVLRKVVGDGGSIGIEYGLVSELLFGDVLDAGKTMGLAPFGSRLEKPMFLEAVGASRSPLFKPINPAKRRSMEAAVRKQRDLSFAGFDLLAPEPTALASSVQFEVEEALLEYAKWIKVISNSNSLCLAGGVALNCVANTRLATKAGFGSVFVPPAPGDDGIAIGCALYGAAQHGEVIDSQGPLFVGRPYKHEPEEFAKLGLLPLSPAPNIYSTIAENLASGHVVGWYQGGAEVGPRALGHRSFLADPRSADLRNHLNKVVKNRELFRPFAPVVLDHAVNDYFEESLPSYFMSFVAHVRENKRTLLSGITHVDGTARYQVLRQSDNPDLYILIQEFYRLTGVPMLLNTSLNRAGEPIVETPCDAARCVLSSEVDYLVVDGKAYVRSSAS